MSEISERMEKVLAAARGDTKSSPIGEEAGPELDRLVAEAVGLERRPTNYRDSELYGAVVYGWYDPENLLAENHPNKFAQDYMYAEAFSPSTDLRDAFWAAERVGLWDETLLAKDGEWHIIEITYRSTFEYRVISEAETPALALCNAILELRK